MSDYVDRMDLSTFGTDDEGNPAEYMPMSETYSPVLHRIDQAVRWRAVHPTEPVPPPYEILTRYQHPPKPLLAKSKRQLEAVIAAADVKKVPAKAQSRKRARNEVKPLSGLDVGALLTQRPKTSNNQSSSSAKISAQNPIPEFKQALDNVGSPAAIRDLAQQFGRIIETRISESFGDMQYPRVLEELGVLRAEMVENEEPKAWNDFVRQLKTKLLSEQLGGDRKDMWHAIRRQRLGLLDKKASESSSVDEEEAQRFLSSK